MHLPKIKKLFESLQLKVDNSFLPIVFRNLTFSIDEKKILSRLNLSIKSTSITVIMGPNGAGKSILLKLINGILEPSSGAILWNGNKITSDLKRKQALIFQKPILLGISFNYLFTVVSASVFALGGILPQYVTLVFNR